MTIATAGVPRLHGVHHTAFPTWKPKSTVAFYRDGLGLPIHHAITAKGWGRGEGGHPDFLHFFFDAGNDSAIAFFYYIGTERRAEFTALKGYLGLTRHTAWAARDPDELERWRRRIAATGQKVSDVIAHETIHSIYFRDPNGYNLEITCQTRPIAAADRRDAELSIAAMVDIFGDDNPDGHTIEDFWRRKGALVRAEFASA
ncbi:MAG: VOC family protein [Rhodospirillaceae bacterium]|nr:VOC family protein [Rhodospirillaceae bacterium]